MEEEAGKRCSVDGLGDLRVLMDALLPRVFTGGRPGEGLFRALPGDLIRAPGTAGAGGGDMNDRGTGSSRPDKRMQIRCLNPQTLGVAGEDRGTCRRVERYFRRGHSAGPQGGISCIRRNVLDNPPVSRPRVILHVRMKRWYWGPEDILPTDAPEPGDGTLQPKGKGSRHGEAEA